MHLTRRLSGRLTTIALVAVTATTAPAQTPDTIDVPLGSNYVDFSKHTPGSTRAFQRMTRGATTRSLPPVRWTFEFDDKGPQKLLIVRSEPDQPNPRAPRSPVYVFDRTTLALLETRDAASGATQVKVDGAHVSGTMMSPAGPRTIDATLTRPAFLGPLADLLVESLPRKVGVVYRAPTWAPPEMTIMTHLYKFVRREDVTVLGKTYPKAWVVEDRNEDGARLLSTLWLVDASPNLVRWLINMPNGAVITLEQEAIDSHH